MHAVLGFDSNLFGNVHYLSDEGQPFKNGIYIVEMRSFHILTSITCWRVCVASDEKNIK